MFKTQIEEPKVPKFGIPKKPKCAECGKKGKKKNVIICQNCNSSCYCDKQCLEKNASTHKDVCKTPNEQYEDYEKRVEEVDALLAKEVNERNSQLKKKSQNEEVTIPVASLYDGVYEWGECHFYPGQSSRLTSEEVREREAVENFETMLNDARYGAEVHRQVRSFVRKSIKPGQKLIDICERVENKVAQLMGSERSGTNVKIGTSFPTGISVNSCAAHYTPLPGDNSTLKKGDIFSIDFGTHRNGRIIDSAFTMAFEPQFDNLIAASKAATEAGVREAGIDARLSEIGAVIHEVMESFEVTLNGKTMPVKVIQNLSGHSIEPYKIHAGKSVSCVRTPDRARMLEYEFYAVETFASTGAGWIEDEGDCSHFMIAYDNPNPPMPRNNACRKLLKKIEENFGTLAFCQRYMDNAGITDYTKPLMQLVKDGIIQDYPPLCDRPGSYTSQFEHSIVLRPSCKEILTRGDDY